MRLPAFQLPSAEKAECVTEIEPPLSLVNWTWTTRNPTRDSAAASLWAIRSAPLSRLLTPRKTDLAPNRFVETNELARFFPVSRGSYYANFSLILCTTLSPQQEPLQPYRWVAARMGQRNGSFLVNRIIHCGCMSSTLESFNSFGCSEYDVSRARPVLHLSRHVKVNLENPALSSRNLRGIVNPAENPTTR